MANIKYTAEQIIGKLLKVEVILAQGSTAGQACRKIAVTGQT